MNPDMKGALGRDRVRQTATLPSEASGTALRAAPGQAGCPAGRITVRPPESCDAFQDVVRRPSCLATGRLPLTVRSSAHPRD